MHTFLFTDIEGSTALWERHGEQMRAAIALHDEILYRHIEQGRGRVVKWLGDGVFAAFDQSGDPLRCARDMQQAINAADWGTIGPLRIRIALNAGYGQTYNGGTDYLGPAVNRAAGLLHAARGGQILLTPEVLHACSIPPLAAVRHIGLHSLKRDTNPLQLFELVSSNIVETSRERR